jgi:hypothetical protein
MSTCSAKHNTSLLVSRKHSLPTPYINIEDITPEGRKNKITDLQETKLKIKIHKIIILPVALYGCETWSLT